MKSERRETAIAHAIKTTGTIQVSCYGVYSGDGKRSLDPLKHYNTVAEETKKFLQQRCDRYTLDDKHNYIKRLRHQEYRLRRLAKLAIDAGKYEIAGKLVDKAKHVHGSWMEVNLGNKTIYRIREGVTV